MNKKDVILKLKEKLNLDIDTCNKINDIVEKNFIISLIFLFLIYSTNGFMEKANNIPADNFTLAENNPSIANNP